MGIYPLWDKQLEAMRAFGLDPATPNYDPVEEMLYGGQAGGGKSYLARAIATTLCLKWPGVVIPVFRRRYPELEETHIRTIQTELPAALGKYSVDRKEYRFNNGSVLEFRHCNDEADVFSYLSAEWGALIIDEATHFTGNMVSMLRSRVRSTRPGWRPLILYCSNPGGIGHEYFKQSFVDPFPESTVFEAPREDGGLTRMFLRARLSDNPALDEVGYSRVLGGIRDPDMRRAMQDGDWDLFAGQMFSQWRYDRHVVEPFEVPGDWLRWRGVDWGRTAPFCCVWVARDPVADEATGLHPLYVYREVYETDLNPTPQALLIRRSTEEGGDPHVANTYADPAMFSKDAHGVPLSRHYAAVGVPLVKGNNDRVAGWQRIHQALELHPGFGPELRIFRNCHHLIRTLPKLPRSTSKPEDVDTRSEDHAADALRYALMGGSGMRRHIGTTLYHIGGDTPSRFTAKGRVRKRFVAR